MGLNAEWMKWRRMGKRDKIAISVVAMNEFKSHDMCQVSTGQWMQETRIHIAIYWLVLFLEKPTIRHVASEFQNTMKQSIIIIIIISLNHKRTKIYIRHF